jgi:hypothetical protein
MYVVGAGLLLFGAICGATIRLVPFILILVVAVAIVAGITAFQSGGAILLNCVISLVTLQLGYGIGVIARAYVFRRQAPRQR